MSEEIRSRRRSESQLDAAHLESLLQAKTELPDDVARNLKAITSNSVLAEVDKTQKEAINQVRQITMQLAQFNEFSLARYQEISSKLSQHTNNLRELKVDLDSVFQRIRTLKSRVAKRHPAMYEYVESLQRKDPAS